jgi:arylsulfatase A-like enzyme
MGYSVRDETWRYTEWDDGKKGAELYNEKADPGELRNLATDPKQAKVLDRMKRLLRSARGLGE